jgi:hypothetical protein
MKDLYSGNLSSFRGQYIGKCPLSFPWGGGREYKLMSFEEKKTGGNVREKGRKEKEKGKKRESCREMGSKRVK